MYASRSDGEQAQTLVIVSYVGKLFSSSLYQLLVLVEEESDLLR
jgi:hypothetical protein